MLLMMGGLVCLLIEVRLTLRRFYIDAALLVEETPNASQ
jgi:hypothetical protein